MGDGALLKDTNLRQVLDKTTLVYLKLSLASIYWKLRHQAAGPHPLLLQPPESTGGNSGRCWPKRQGGFDQAHVTLDMDDMTLRGGALRHLLDKLPQWGTARPLA